MASFELSEMSPLPRALRVTSWCSGAGTAAQEPPAVRAEVTPLRGVGRWPTPTPVLQAVERLVLGFALGDFTVPACQGLPFGGEAETCPVMPCRCFGGSKGPAAHLGKVLRGRLPIRGPLHGVLAGQWGDW